MEEYKIIERDSGELNWEMHLGIGALLEGRCFKKGSILFICPAENERPGLLMLEFADHLKRLPEWTKTQYFCTNPEIYHCKTGRKVLNEEMDLWRYDRRLHGSENVFWDNNADDLTKTPAPNLKGDDAFKLHRYQITKREDQYPVKNEAPPVLSAFANGGWRWGGYQIPGTIRHRTRSTYSA